MSRERVAALAGGDGVLLAKLDRYVGLLEKWQRSINLISPSTVGDVWARHVLDSLQLRDAIPDQARTLVDMGSGAGFPGLVLAMARPDLSVHLIESDGRKAEFLRHVSRETSTGVQVWSQRIERVAGTGLAADVVTARALAPLGQLLDLSEPFCHAGTLRLFLKGQGVDAELTRIGAAGTIRITKLPSITAASATIIRVEGVRLG